MVRQLQASESILINIRVTVPGKITDEDGNTRLSEGALRLRYVDLYGSNGETILEDRIDVTIEFSDLEPQQLVMVENLIRVFEDKGKSRLGLV